jgi:hypothetical protein
LKKRSGLISFFAFLAFQGIAVLMTWPLVIGINRDVPGDLGDALLNMWILAWGAERVPLLLTGQITLHDYWNANIFHPEPLALSFSEHLFGQVIQILPLYHLTGNIILCYNLLFLTSFSLSGLGMFLLTRDILRDVVPSDSSRTSDQVLFAAFVAGLIYAFYPFRIAQVAHIQSLSSQWMPLALYGLRRFVRTRSTTALVSGTAALAMQNWSCGYYLMFFAPFVPLFVVHDMWMAGHLTDWRRWTSLAVAGFVVAIVTIPLLMLYLEAQSLYGFQRPLGEVLSFSADVHSYFAAAGALHLWGEVMQAIRKPEGELFFGLLPMALVAIAIAAAVRRLALPTRLFTRILTALLVLQITAVLMIVFTGGFITSVGGIPIRATNATRILTQAIVVFVLLLTVSRRARSHAVTFVRSPVVFSAAMMLLALWMSLGPIPQTRGQLLQVPGLYAFFYDHVPGFDGLRVPARYAMVAAVFVSIVAGAGAASLMRRTRHIALCGASLAAVFIAEAAFAPMPVNVSWGGTYVQPPARVEPAVNAPSVYHQLASMPEETVVAEFPFGDLSWELRYVYYSAVHWKRLVNGYSGGFPQGYKTRAALLQRVALHPDEAWRALRDIGTTHVVVHERAFTPGEADAVKTWLNDHFAVEIARFDGDRLYDLTATWNHRHH